MRAVLSQSMMLSDDRALPPASPSAPYFNILAAWYYIGTATSLTVFNKLLFNAFSAVDPLVLLLTQALTTLTILSVLTAAKRFSPPTLPRDAKTLLAYLPLLVAYSTMLSSSLIALRFTSLLMYNTIRRTSILFVVTLHSWSTRTFPAHYTIMATLLTLVGALFASLTDLTFDPVGYALAFIANASTAVFLVLLKPVRDRLQYSNMQLLFFNTLCITPVLIFLISIMPPSQSILPLFSSSIKFCILFAFSCGLAVVITHATYVNTIANDAVTQTVCAQVKDVLLLTASFFFVDNPSGRANGNLVGVMIGFVGSIIYAVGKLRASTELPNSPKDVITSSSPNGKQYSRVSNDEE